MHGSDDVLSGASWWCLGVPAGEVASPDHLPPPGAPWCPAPVPGTVAGALRAAGRWTWSMPDEELLDRRDWWYRTEVAVPAAGRWWLRSAGLATAADVWVGGRLVARSTSMWLPVGAEADLAAGRVEVAIRCAALPQAGGRPRARWRTALLREPSLRWLRTSLAGRIPGVSEGAAAVGPWRGVQLVPAGATAPAAAVRPELRGDQGWLHVRLDGSAGGAVEVRCAGRSVRATLDGDGRATVGLGEVERWWPHTAGTPARHRVEVTAGGEVVADHLVGFRTVELRTGGPGPLVVNGVPLFVRGAVWAVPDQVGLDESPAALRRSLERVRRSGANTVRVAGTSQYPPGCFWDLCDELGLLVWQDCMLAGADPPADEGWEGLLAAEVAANLAPVAGRPSLAVVVGSNEAYQRAAMFGLPSGSWRSRALEEVVPAALGPGVAYLASTPVGGDLPFHPRGGIAHYFGVGAYRRPLDDAATAGVALAAECLAFAVPPEPSTLRRWRASGEVVAWSAGTPRDPGAAWDFTDVTDHYVAELLGGHPAPPADRAGGTDVPGEGALDLRRAAVCTAMAATFARWRTPASGCGGGLVLSWQDRRPGPGWGLLDADGAPKAPWWVLRRLWRPRAVWITDEGLGGLAVHVANDGSDELRGELRLRAIDATGHTTVAGEAAVGLAPRSAESWSDARLVGAFRDLNGAYAFGPPAHVAVVAELHTASGVVGTDVHLPGWVAPAAPSQAAPAADLERVGDGWLLHLASDGPLAWVAIDLDGWEPEDNWFHLEPGATRAVPLSRLAGSTGAPAGSVRALNASGQVTIAG